VNRISCEYSHSASSGTVRGVAEASFLVGCDSVSLGVHILMFHRIMMSLFKG